MLMRGGRRHLHKEQAVWNVTLGKFRSSLTWSLIKEKKGGVHYSYPGNIWTVTQCVMSVAEFLGYIKYNSKLEGKWGWRGTNEKKRWGGRDVSGLGHAGILTFILNETKATGGL